MVYFAWCVGFFAAAGLVGLLPAVLLFMIAYIRFGGGESWAMALVVSVPLWLFCYVLFHTILFVAWPPSLIGNVFPVLRTVQSLNIF
jgi:hypothetical protein